MTQQTKRSTQDPQVHPGAPPAFALPAAAASAPRAVRLIAGADVQDMDLAGHSVAEARAVAQAVFGIHPAAAALVDGRAVGEDHRLEAGQQIEFTKYSGQKGAVGGEAPSPSRAGRALIVEVSEDRAVWRRSARVLGSASVSELVERLRGTGEGPDAWRLHPRHVRLMVSRRAGAVTGVVLEMPPGPRRVQWIADDSAAPFGPAARYQERTLSFPWIVLLLVFVRGELSPYTQAFYRSAPIASLDDELYYTNLLNVARGYGQESWVCLVNLARRLGRLGWEERLQTVTAHFWQAAFNRSSEVHERNSHFGATRGLDRRLDSAAAWETATRADPYFALTVAWRKAEQPLGCTLAGMLDAVAPRPAIERVEQLVTLLQADTGDAG
jgi:hypothetical protein